VAVADLVNRHKLQTPALGKCASARPLVFVDGQQRWVAQGEEAGFHRPHLLDAAFSLIPAVSHKVDFMILDGVATDTGPRKSATA
jgi:hypothetical protein